MSTSASITATDAAVVLDTNAAKATLPKRKEDGTLSRSESSELARSGDHTMESLSDAQAEMRKAQAILVDDNEVVRFGTDDHAQLKVLDTNDFAFAYYDSEAQKWLVAVSHGDPHLAAMYIDPEDLKAGGELADLADADGNLDINKVDFGEKFNGPELKEKGFDHIADYYNADTDGGTTFVTDGGVKITVDTEEIASGENEGKTLGVSVYASVSDAEETLGIEISLEKSEAGEFKKTLLEGQAAVKKDKEYNDGEIVRYTGYTDSKDDAGKFFVMGDPLTALEDLVPEGAAIAVLESGNVANEIEVEATFRYYPVETDSTTEANLDLLESATKLIDSVNVMLNDMDEIGGELPDSYVSLLESTADIFDSIATLIDLPASDAVAVSQTSDEVANDTTGSDADNTSDSSVFNVSLAEDEEPISEVDTAADDYVNLYNSTTARLLSGTSMLNL